MGKLGQAHTRNHRRDPNARGSWLAARLNMRASVGLGLLGVFLGVGMARLIG